GPGLAKSSAGSSRGGGACNDTPPSRAFGARHLPETGSGRTYTNAATAQIAPTISAAPVTSSSAPDRTMRGRAILPVAQAIALGPVPAGSMKPQLAAIAAGSASSSGSAPSATVRLATIGMMPLAVATLLANSVIRITKAT